MGHMLKNLQTTITNPKVPGGAKNHEAHAIN